jgi:hypothetical protein
MIILVIQLFNLISYNPKNKTLPYPASAIIDGTRLVNPFDDFNEFVAMLSLIIATIADQVK